MASAIEPVCPPLIYSLTSLTPGVRLCVHMSSAELTTLLALEWLLGSCVLVSLILS